MNDLLEKIYNNVLVYENDVVKTSQAVDEEINRVVEPYKNQLHDNQLEELKSLLSSTALVAEVCGFKNGIRFVFKVIGSLLS